MRASVIKSAKLAGMALAGGGLALISVWGVLECGSRFVEIPQSLLHAPPAPRDILDRNGITLRVLPRVNNAADGMSVMPLNVRRALLAAEDRRFLSHSGVDPMRILRAAWDNFRAGRIVSGASTITQQLIKISAPPEQRVLKRGLRVKWYEACAALRLERMWSKERILLEYANRVDLGYLNTGVQAASAFYFGKEPQYLSTAETALLVGVAQAPSRLNPIRNPRNAKTRQLTVLERLHRFGWISGEEWERAVAQALPTSAPGRPFRAPHFVDLLLQRGIPAGVGEVLTSLDSTLQQFVEGAVRKQLRLLSEQRVTQAAAVVLDNQTGEVLALVGSANYSDAVAGQVNGAWAPRSPGSALKPFTYLLALEAGMSPGTLLPDIPSVFETVSGSYEPENFDRQFRGPILMRQALANSLNVPAVFLMDALGGPKPLYDRLRRYGISTLRRTPGHYGLGLTIGNAEVRLLELANAYACLARLDAPAPFTLLRSDARVPKGSSENAWLIADMLADNSARSATFGRRSNLRFDFPVACKTGTSTSFRDNWALGFTPEFTVGVWAGNFDGMPMKNVTGVTGAGAILHDVFEYLNKTGSLGWYASPAGWQKVPIHRTLGKLEDSPSSTEEWFREGEIPPSLEAGDFTEDGRVRLDSRYAEWLGEKNAHPEFAADKLRHVVIRHPRAGTRFIHDPDTPGSEWIPLRADSPNPVMWESQTLRFVKRGNSMQATGTPGSHAVTARDSVTGEAHTVEFEIQRW